jgi:hypothetical protein
MALMVGNAEETDADTIEAEIVTRSDSLVQRVRIDRHSGHEPPDRS